MNLAIFASGNGTNFEAICKAVEEGRIHHATIKLLIVDHEDAYAITRAKNHHIPYEVVLLKNFASKKEYEEHILSLLKENEVDLICLAGYMKIITSVLLEAYPDKIINIHPALLPSFKGAHGIQDAFDYGCKVFGVTIHYVSAQAFEYYGSDVDELESKIHAVEHELYPSTIEKLIKEEE